MRGQNDIKMILKLLLLEFFHNSSDSKLKWFVGIQWFHWKEASGLKHWFHLIHDKLYEMHFSIISILYPGLEIL